MCISSIDWDFLWQGHQEIAARFAAAGNVVLYVENTGVRSVRAGDALRLLGKVGRSMRQSALGIRRRRHGVEVVAPFLLPFPRSALARAVNDRILLPRLASRLRREATGDPIILTFLPTPTARRLISLLRGPRSVVVYYCIADFRELSDLGADLEASERDIVRGADLVFVQGHVFAARFAGLAREIHEFRFGVDLDTFDPATVRDLHPAVRGLPRPIIGYSGGVHRHVDVGLVARVAEAFAAGSVVLVGPVQGDVEALRARPNVHVLGMRPFSELPSLIAGFDVALIPYVRTAYTDTVFPTKLFEYLAMGRPVVSTDLPEVRDLGLPADAVRLAPDADAFVEAVRSAVASSAAGREARIALARSRDWGTIVRRMSDLIARAGAAR